MKYRKKPVIVDCIQWTGENIDEVKGFVGNSLHVYMIDVSAPNGHETKTIMASISIMKLEGEHSCRIGDYIIKGVNGEFYPCKPDIFEQTYEKAEEQENEDA